MCVGVLQCVYVCMWGGYVHTCRIYYSDSHTKILQQWLSPKRKVKDLIVVQSTRLDISTVFQSTLESQRNKF